MYRELFSRHGLLLEPSAEGLIRNEDLLLLIEFAKSRKEVFITSELVKEFYSRKIESFSGVRRREGLIFYDDKEISGKSVSRGKVEDFVSLFRDRFNRISRILKSHPSNYPLVTTHGVERGERCRFIGMVREKMVTKNGHLIIIAEDEHGYIKVFIHRSKRDLLAKGERVILDEVLAFEGRFNSPFFYADDIIWPDIPVNHGRPLTEEDISVVLISDVHVGSKLFLENSFKRMIDWLNGAGQTQRERYLASTVG